MLVDQVSLNIFSEAMHGDFTAGVSVVSLVNLASRGAVRPMMRESLSIASLPSRDPDVSSESGLRLF